MLPLPKMAGKKIKDVGLGMELKIPSAPKKMNSYQYFFKTQSATVRGASVMTMITEQWKSLDPEAKASYERAADEAYRKSQADWIARADDREQDRISAAKKLNANVTATWDDLYALVEERNKAAPPKDLTTTTTSSKKKKTTTTPTTTKKKKEPQPSKKRPTDRETLVRRSRDYGSCWRGTERRKAVLKALDAIFKMAEDPKNFEQFGNDMIQCFYDIASVTSEPVRHRALMYVEQLAQRWRHSILARGWRPQQAEMMWQPPPPQKILDVIVGLYCMERCGVSSANLKRDVAEVLEKTSMTYTVPDYLGWDPRKGPPPGGSTDVMSGAVTSRYRALCTALTYAFYADAVGLNLGCSYAEVLVHAAKMRPYKGPRGFAHFDDYTDQCYLVTHVVFTLSHWGELSLEPRLLPHEYYFLKENFLVAIRQRDVHLVGEYVECLRVFGSNDADAHVKLGIAFLLSTQSPTSHAWDDLEDPYTCYHATMVAAQGLLAHTTRGAGPGIPGAVPVLHQWLHDDDDDRGHHPDAVVAAFVDAKLRPTDAGGPTKRPRTESPVDAETVQPKAQPVPKSTLLRLERLLQQATQDEDWSTVKQTLTQLSNAIVDVDSLAGTTVGRTVNKLKKVQDNAIADAAKALVRKWKDIVKTVPGTSSSTGPTTTDASNIPPLSRMFSTDSTATKDDIPPPPLSMSLGE